MKIHLQQPRKKKRNTRKTRQKTHIHVASASCRSEIQRKCCGENKPSSGFGQSHNSLFLGNATHTHRNNIIGHLNHSTYLLFYSFFAATKEKETTACHRIASHRITSQRRAPQIYPFRIAISSLQTVAMSATASNAWLRAQRKSDLVELAEGVGLQK